MLACASALPAQASTSTSNEDAGQVEAGNENPGTAQAGQDWVREAGSASWYAASRHAWRTASGARYDQQAMTAAHPWLPFGAKVRVTRRDTGHSIIVTINDRLPSKKHIIDLSVGAAQQLGMIHQGTTLVDLEPA